MKILHMIDSAGMYGAETMLISLMQKQKEAGLAPILGSIGKKQEGEKLIEQVAHGLRLDVKPFRFRSGFNLLGALQILYYASVTGVNLLHSHGYKTNILLGLIPGKFRKIPLICTLHGWTSTRSFSKIALYTWLECRILKYLDAVVIVNSLVMADKRFVGAAIPEDKLHRIPNGIDTKRVHSNYIPDESDEIYRFTQKGRAIAAIGRLSAEKCFDHLIEAIFILYPSLPDIRLVIIGDGYLKHELREKIKSLGLINNILLAGYRNNARRYLPLFKALVISSMTEGLPIVMLEAMVTGVPVIATRVGGIPEVINDGESGILVSCANPEELSYAIKRLFNDEELACKIKTTALLHVREKFNSKAMSEKYQKLYEGLSGKS